MCRACLQLSDNNRRVGLLHGLQHGRIPSYTAPRDDEIYTAMDLVSFSVRSCSQYADELLSSCWQAREVFCTPTQQVWTAHDVIRPRRVIMSRRFLSTNVYDKGLYIYTSNQFLSGKKGLLFFQVFMWPRAPCTFHIWEGHIYVTCHTRQPQDQ